MIMRARPNYNWEKKIQSLEPDQFAKFIAAADSLRMLNVSADTKQEAFTDACKHVYGDLLMDAD